MLVIVARQDHQYTFRTSLEISGSPYPRGPIILCYKEFLSLPSLPVGDYIFADFERLEEDIISSVEKRLKSLLMLAPDIKVLNRPVSSFRRVAVMEKLHADGMNSFRAVAADNIPEDLRFPAFVRGANDHEGPKSGLLYTQEELEGAIETLQQSIKRRDEIMVTEYVDTRDEAGRHHKISYFRVGDRYFPGAYNVGSNWILKGFGSESDSAELLREREEFLRSNTLEDLVRGHFESAGISYGRIDFALVNGRAEVFEINTNPMLVPPCKLPRVFRGCAQTILNNWKAALLEFSPICLAEHPRWIPVAERAQGHLDLKRQGSLRNLVHRVLRRSNQLHLESQISGKLRRVGLLHG